MGMDQFSNGLLRQPITIILLVGSACASSDSSIPSITYSKDYFPNSVGNEWVYSVYDSVLAKQETVIVKIVGTKMLSTGQIGTIWTFHYPERTDTNYVVIQNDTVVFHSSSLFGVTHTYVIALFSGESWIGDWIYDQYSVPTIGSKIVNKVQFDSAAQIREYGYSPNFLRRKDEWFVPRLGMVYRYRFEYDFSLPDIKVWTLVSSKLALQ